MKLSEFLLAADGGRDESLRQNYFQSEGAKEAIGPCNVGQLISPIVMPVFKEMPLL